MAEHDVYIGVGSNIDPETNIVKALQPLTEHVQVHAISTFYRTAPLDRPEQPPFVNGVVEVGTEIEARPLKFDLLRPIEKALGRVRTEDPFAARTIDLDILLFDDAVIHEPSGPDGAVHIPDPEIAERPFWAIPLLELAPDLILPGTATPLAQASALHCRSDLHPMHDFTTMLRERFAV